MALATIASVAAIVGAAASLSAMGYQAAQGAPKIPSGASASREIAEAQAAELANQRRLAAAEQMGTTTTLDVAKHKEKTQAVQVIPIKYVNQRQPDGSMQSVALPQYGLAEWVKFDAKDWEPGGKYADASKFQQGKQKVKSVSVPAHTQNVDFTGYGTADIESELARKYADMQQELGRKYGVPFAEEARREAELADPQGTAARKMEYELIQKELGNPQPISPLSPMLQDQIDAQLRAGRGLDPMTKDLLDRELAAANVARGGQVGAGDVATSMSTGAEGQARLQAAQRAGQGFISSGTTPADIEYRREQQNLANLGSFVGGRTPESQFGAISGQGAAPFVPAQQAPTMPGGAAAAGPAYSVSAYNAATNAATQQANPWMAGISSLLSGLSAYGKATA